MSKRKREKYKDIESGKDKRIKERLRSGADLESDPDLIQDNEKAIGRYFRRNKK